MFMILFLIIIYRISHHGGEKFILAITWQFGFYLFIQLINENFGRIDIMP